ncbi:MAG TPA: hypothetical protein VH475_20055 [Tepidisphaeraceae bacterium]|jgi:hypothetical protein
MTLEQLEFAITQYLDGTLPPGEVAALERALAGDSQAQALRNEHERLTALLRSQPAPEIDWADVARDLSAVVTGSVDEASRAEDQKLNAILKNVAPLPVIRWEALSRHISAAVDAEVAATDAHDQQLDNLLRAASPMPAINWDRLGAHLSNAVTREADEEERPAVIGRIGWIRTVGALAVAACVMVATGLGIRAYLGGGGGGRGGETVVQVPTPHPVAAGYVRVDGPTVETVGQPAVAEVSIGPSKAYAASNEELYDRGVANRSPVVIVTPVAGDASDDVEHWLGVE